MMDVLPFLTDLISDSGLSGFERPVANKIAETWRPLVDELSFSALGSLHGLRRSSISEKSPSLMIAAHMDAIGMMVKSVEDGLIYITRIGGVDPRVLPGQLVTVFGKKELQGIVQMLPDRLLETEARGKAPAFERLFIDTGLSARDLDHCVRAGDLVAFRQPPLQFEGRTLAGHSLDNRASVAAVTVCLDEIRKFNLDWNVFAVATTGEETTYSGAITSAFSLKPDLAVAVDVTFADGPGSNDYRTFPLGGGPTIGTGANNHPALTRRLVKLAEEIELPYHLEAMPVSSSTDGMPLQISRSGIPTVVVSVPLRYMHTSVEMVSLNDIERTGRLLARLITNLNSDTLSDWFNGESQ